MTMKMNPVEVYVGQEGAVCIKQDEGFGEPSVIGLHPSQVQAVAEWMLRCVPEAEAITNAGGGEAFDVQVARLEAECGRLREELASAQEELAKRPPPRSGGGPLN